MNTKNRSVRNFSRYRLVTRTSTADGTEEHVSTVVLSAHEASQHLLIEETMHRLSGWATVLQADELVCVRPDKTRTIFARGDRPLQRRDY